MRDWTWIFLAILRLGCLLRVKGRILREIQQLFDT